MERHAYIYMRIMKILSKKLQQLFESFCLPLYCILFEKNYIFQSRRPRTHLLPGASIQTKVRAQ